MTNRIRIFLQTPAALLDAIGSTRDPAKWKKQVVERAAGLAKDIGTTYR